MPAKSPPPPKKADLQFHPKLSIKGLLKNIRIAMLQVTDYRTGFVAYSLYDALMSGFSIFALKYPSLLQFDKSGENPQIRYNLNKLYGIENAPSDTHLRTILDEISPYELRPAFISLINQTHTDGVLDDYMFMGKLLLSMDGTGYYHSEKVSCPHCCVKTHKDGTTSYYHQLMGAAIVYPGKKQVFPLFPEIITKQDGATKNDCESNAAKRLLPAIHEALPKLNYIVLEDALGADAPNIKMIKKQGDSYIITVMPSDQPYLYSTVLHRIFTDGKGDEFEVLGDDGVTRGYRFINHVPLNKSNQDVLVNYLDYWEVKDDKKIYTHQWVTDIPLTRENVNDMMRAARARWKVENETFNTLKNLGYNLEHNYGHGKKNLSTVLTHLMMLAFLVDQIQERVCILFKSARNKSGSRIALWERIRGLFCNFHIQSWEDLWLAIIFDWSGGELKPNIPDTS